MFEYLSELPEFIDSREGPMNAVLERLDELSAAEFSLHTLDTVAPLLESIAQAVTTYTIRNNIIESGGSLIGNRIAQVNLLRFRAIIGDDDYV